MFFSLIAFDSRGSQRKGARFCGALREKTTGQDLAEQVGREYAEIARTLKVRRDGRAKAAQFRETFRRDL
jgi:hypothetical protein